MAWEMSITEQIVFTAILVGVPVLYALKNLRINGKPLLPGWN